MERFELLQPLTFKEERQQLAFIGNVPPSPYIRICTQLRDGETLSPLVGISAVLGSSAIVDRFRQCYLVADERKRDELAPKVAKGFAAVLLKNAKRVRGRWRLPNKDALIKSYRSAAEEGTPFNIEEWEAHVDEEKSFWCDYRDVLERTIPKELFNLVRDTIADYCHSPLPDPDRFPPLLELLKGDERQYDTLVSEAQNATSFSQMWRVIRNAKKQSKNPGATMKAIASAMQKSKLFELLNNGESIEDNYKRLKAH